MCMFCVDRCLSFFAWPLCVVCPSSIYGFVLPLWYLQTILPNEIQIVLQCFGLEPSGYCHHLIEEYPVRAMMYLRMIADKLLI
jgi:hypothetical protein